MLSTLPKLADKAFIIGFLLPMIAFFISLFYLFSDVPQIAFVLKALAEKESFEKLAYVALANWFAAIVLMMLNDILYRMLEGYRWPISWFPFLRKRKLDRFEAMSTRFALLREAWKKEGDLFPVKSRPIATPPKAEACH